MHMRSIASCCGKIHGTGSLKTFVYVTMRGFTVFLIILFGATDHAVSAETCTTCQNTKASALTAGADAAAKCTGLKDYITCLDSTDEGSDGCPLGNTFAAVISNFDAKTCTSGNELSTACVCQKTFWGNGGGCSGIATLESCTAKITDATVKGCDGKKSASEILSKAKTGLTCPPPTEPTTHSTNLKATTESSKGVRISDDNGLLATLLMSMLGIFFMKGS